MFGFSEKQIAGILVIIVIFFIIREVMCWYWKINQNIALLTEIRNLLKTRQSTPKETEAEVNNEAKRPEPPGSKLKTLCDHCGSLTPVSNLKTYNGKQLCPACLRKAKK